VHLSRIKNMDKPKFFEKSRDVITPSLSEALMPRSARIPREVLVGSIHGLFLRGGCGPSTICPPVETFCVNSLGCKVNQYEANQARQQLERLGLRPVGLDGAPDLVVVQTCCVTGTAAAKSRQLLRRARRINPAAHIVITGCLPAIDSGELPPLGANMTAITDPDRATATLSAIVQSDPSPLVHRPSSIAPAGDSRFNTEPTQAPATTSRFAGHTRAFLKVQDGCDGWCAYCIVPRTRPRLSSKPVDEVLAEARALVAAGHKEIVVSGVFLGAYGRDTVKRCNWTDRSTDRLAELLNRLAEVDGLARIRLSSLEPGDITESLADCLCSHPNIMPHLHLSLQSGSDRILKRMRRQYTGGQYLDVVAMLKSRLDRPAITTDIIVGFPGETDEDFDQTISLAQAVGFSRVHVFPFSPRQGTAAAQMSDPIDPAIIRHRSQTLRRLAADLAQAFREQFIGETAEVLIESQTSRVAAFREAKGWFDPALAFGKDRHPDAIRNTTYEIRNTNDERRTTYTASGRTQRYFTALIEDHPTPIPKGAIRKVQLTANRPTHATARIS